MKHIIFPRKSVKKPHEAYPVYREIRRNLMRFLPHACEEHYCQCCRPSKLAAVRPWELPQVRNNLFPF